MFGLGIGELVLILGIVILFFGSNKIPELARGLGKAINEFNDARNESKDKINKDI